MINAGPFLKFLQFIWHIKKDKEIYSDTKENEDIFWTSDQNIIKFLHYPDNFLNSHGLEK